MADSRRGNRDKRRGGLTGRFMRKIDGENY